MKRSEARQAAGRVVEIKDASADTIARYCQPSGPKKTSMGGPVRDTLDTFVRTSTPAGGSRPGTANGGSIFGTAARAASSKAGRIACDSVFPLDVSDAPAPHMPPQPAHQAAPMQQQPPSVFGGRGGRGVDKASVFPDGVPPPSALAPTAGRPRADPTAGRPPMSAQSAAAEFAALGLGNVKPPQPSAGMPQYGMKQPAYGQPSPFGQPAAVPNYVQAMRALPAAGSRSNAPAPFRIG